MARMAEAKGASDGGAERDTERASAPAATVVALFRSEPLELDGPKLLRADELFFLDGR